MESLAGDTYNPFTQKCATPIGVYIEQVIQFLGFAPQAITYHSLRSFHIIRYKEHYYYC